MRVVVTQRLNSLLGDLNEVTLFNLLHQRREINWLLHANLPLNHRFRRLRHHFVIIAHIFRFNFSLRLHVEHFEDRVAENRHSCLLEDQYGVAQNCHQLAFNWRGKRISFILLRVDPNVAIGAENAADRRLPEEFMHMALHPADQVIVNFHQHAVAELAILLRASVQLNFAVEAANLLDLGRDQVTFDVVVAYVQLVLLHSPTLDATR